MTAAEWRCHFGSIRWPPPPAACRRRPLHNQLAAQKPLFGTGKVISLHFGASESWYLLLGEQKRMDTKLLGDRTGWPRTARWRYEPGDLAIRDANVQR